MKRYEPSGRIFENPDLDWNACTVHAVMAVMEIDYHHAKEICAKAGRKFGKGAYSHKVIQQINIQFGINTMLSVPNKDDWFKYSLSQFVSHYPVGRFYVNIHRHAFSVINGEVVDTTTQIRKPGAHVNGAWVRADGWMGNRASIANVVIPEF